MRQATTNEFLDWARERGVVPNFSYSHPDRDYYNLHIESAANLFRYWLIPYETDNNSNDEVRLHYVCAALIALGEWQTCGLLKRERGWNFETQEPWTAGVLNSLGVPSDYDGALFFDRSDFAALFGVALTLSAFGWCVSYDVFVVPDHGRQIIRFDHDLGIVGYFANEQACEAYTERLAAKEIYLPKEPLASFLRWPEWMGPKPDDWDTRRE